MPPSLIFQASAAPQSDQPLCGGPADLLEMTLCEQIRRPKKPSFGLQPKATKTASVAKRAPNAAPAKAKSGKKASAAKKAPKSLNVPNLAPIAPSRLRSAPFFVPSRVLTPPQRAPPTFRLKPVRLDDPVGLTNPCDGDRQHMGSSPGVSSASRRSQRLARLLVIIQNPPPKDRELCPPGRECQDQPLDIRIAASSSTSMSAISRRQRSIHAASWRHSCEISSKARPSPLSVAFPPLSACPR